MVRVTFVSPDGTARQLIVPEGHSVMEAAVKEGIPGIEAECGGAAACATCHIYVGEGYSELVGEPDDMEDEMLEDAAAERRATSRLSCQITLNAELDGLSVEIPVSQ